MNKKHLWPGLGAWVWLISFIFILLLGGMRIWLCICSLWATQCYTPVIWVMKQPKSHGQQDRTGCDLLCFLCLMQFGQQSMAHTRRSIKYVFGWINEWMNEWVLEAHGETALWVFHFIFMLSILMRCERGALAARANVLPCYVPHLLCCVTLHSVVPAACTLNATCYI